MTQLRHPTPGHHYDLLISGAGPPILLLHGFSGDKSTWRGLRAILESAWQVIALDLLGHGDSDVAPESAAYRMENAADDIVSLLDRLAIERAHLLGYSMGGRLALYLALHHGRRFQSVILESASPGLATAAERKARRASDHDLAARIESGGIARFVEEWERLPLWDQQRRSLPAALWQQQRRQRMRNDPLGLANSLRGMGTGAQPSLWNLLPRLSRPALLIVGERDPKFRDINRRMAELIPDARLAIVPGAGHNTHLENPPGFARLVTRFLRIHS